MMPNEAERRVDITIGGKPFTSYIWPERVKKPVLDPIRSASGTQVTRGWPLNPRPGERADHPHHVGLWFNYESVNGIDFWNNSDAIKPQDAPKMGTIVHRRIVSARSGDARGELVTESDWVLPGGKTLMRERTQFFFSGDETTRTIERIATLTALEQARGVRRREGQGCSGCGWRGPSSSRRPSRWCSRTSPAGRPRCR